jgi:putative ABC transport system permease protein
MMYLLESLRIALRGLSANKLRSALTMLGIIIGVAAVITLLSVGQGVQTLVTSSLESIGTNLLFVFPGNIQSMGAGARFTTAAYLTLRDADAIRNEVANITAIAPSLQGTADVEYGKTTIRTTLIGTTPEYGPVRNYQPADGTFLTPEHQATGARVAVLGWRLASKLFPPDVYPIGQTIKINRIPFRVIGVLKEKGGGSFGSQDDVVMVPLSVAQQRLYPNRRSPAGEPLISVIDVQVDSQKHMDSVAAGITDVLRQLHRLKPEDDNDFTVISQADLISIFGQITGVLTIFLGAIAGISLLVGGIGIMNIMLVSVTERTREIGIRKAVGAKRRDILLQFLIEALVLSLIGGAFGIMLGIAGALVVDRLSADLTTVITPQAILLATGFSAAVGLFFGIYPASRAARLNPIEALRYE